MSDIAPIGRPAAAGYTPAANHTRSAPASDAGQRRDSDRVEFSHSAQLLSKLRQLPDVRQDLIDRVRAEIDAGTYETPQRIDLAVAALAEDLED